jgi:hypothetical protein
MNLADRLYIKNFYSWDRKTWFKFKGHQICGANNLIDIVLDRFSKIYGDIENKKARIFQERLAKKYSRNAGLTLSHLKSDFKGGFSYPRRKAADAHFAEVAKELALERHLKAISLLYKYDHGDYCEIKGGYCCPMCEKSNLRIIKANKDFAVHKEKWVGVQINGTYVCNSKKCRALAAYYGKKRNYENMLIEAILDSVKNNERFEKLKRHFI